MCSWTREFPEVPTEEITELPGGKDGGRGPEGYLPQPHLETWAGWDHSSDSSTAVHPVIPLPLVLLIVVVQRPCWQSFS